MEKEYIQLPALKRDLDPDVSNYLRNTKHAIRSNMNC